MSKLQDLSGMIFGYLTVIKRGENRGTGARWVCECTCGKQSLVDGSKLRSGHTKSCGCYVSLFRKTHGEASANRSREYSVWAAMVKRCRNKTDPNYPNYGGRGINVCDRWLSYENFIADVGKRPSNKHSLDRFPNNNGNYEPGNFRWATTEEQTRNKRDNVFLEHEGRRMVITDWAKELGVGSEIYRYMTTGLFKMRQAKAKGKTRKLAA